MKKSIFSFFLFACSCSAMAQSFLDEPFLYLYLGKRANEYSMGQSHPENNYALIRLPFHYPLSGVQLNDNFVYGDLWLSGKGNYSKLTGGYNTRKVYSFLGSDRSMVNGVLLNFAKNKTTFRHELGINVAHRWKRNLADRNHDGWTDQPGKNDFNGVFSYKISPINKNHNLELGYINLTEQTKLEQNTGGPADEFFVFNNRFLMSQVYARARFNDKYSDTKKRVQGFATGVQLISLEQESRLSVHRFDTDQRLLIGSVQYYNKSKEGIGIDLVAGSEYHAARINERFDSVSTIPFNNVWSTNVELGKQLSNKTRVELLYRADLAVKTGTWLHNPGFKWTFRPENNKFSLFAYTQWSHRYVNVIPEYLQYLSTSKTIYRNPTVLPDEFWRSGVNTDITLFQRLRFSVAYHYDYYTVRNVADVHTEPGAINFYRLHHASFDQVIQSKVSYTVGRFDARILYQYTAAKVKMNGNNLNLPFYSPSSFLASISYNNNYGYKRPEAAVSVFYSAPFITGRDAQEQNMYTEAGFSLNARVSLPLNYLGSKLGLMGWTFPSVLGRLGLMLGCDNITNHRQNALYSFSGDGNNVNAVNTWGQYFGRRWVFGLSLDLGKKSSYYY